MGKGEENQQDHQPWCLADNAAIHPRGLGAAHAMPPLPPVPQVTWSMTCCYCQGIFGSSKGLGHFMCSDFHSRQRPIALLCCRLTEEAHSALCFRAQTSQKLSSDHSQKYLMLSRTALLKSPQVKVASDFTNHNPSPVSAARSSQTHLIHLLGGKLLPVTVLSTAI